MLTELQRDALGVIERYVDEHGGKSPSFAEIGAAVGIRSKSGVLRVLICLEERGFIRRLPNRARAIALVKTASVPARARHDLTPELLAMLERVMWSASTDLAAGGHAPSCVYCDAERPSDIRALCRCPLGQLVAQGRAASLQGPQHGAQRREAAE